MVGMRPLFEQPSVAIRNRRAQQIAYFVPIALSNEKPAVGELPKNLGLDQKMQGRQVLPPEPLFPNAAQLRVVGGLAREHFMYSYLFVPGSRDLIAQ
jgi:hypothetical protein